MDAMGLGGQLLPERPGRAAVYAGAPVWLGFIPA